MKKLMYKGFTIIEVIIVLIVGAVIMLAVFLVVPQLQQSSRNSQRQKDAQALLAAANDYVGKGELVASLGLSRNQISPSTTDMPNLINYLPRANFNDPGGSAYGIYMPASGLNTSYYQLGKITIGFDRACTNDKSTASTLLVASPGKIAVVMPLEPFTLTNRFCVDN